MSGTVPKFELHLLGTFRLVAPSGERIEVTSKKGMGLIAMLAMAKEGERSRVWLQEKLWGSRDEEQARGSLRRELSNLRRSLNRGPILLICEHSRVRLGLEHVWIDARSADRSDAAGDSMAVGEFLEGFDVSDAEGFEDWLREQRHGLAERRLLPVPAVAEGGYEGKLADTAGTSHESMLGGAAEPDARPAVPQLPERILDTSQPAPGFDDHPALAVLTFENLTGRQQHDYLAEGIGDELIGRFSRLRWLPVIARNSSSSVAGASLHTSTIGRRLGAKYLLEGRLRAAGDAIAVATTLSEAASGYTIWSTRFELPAAYSRDSLEQLITEVVGAAGTRIDHAEQRRARAMPPVRLHPSDLVWRGRWYLNRLNRADSDIAQALFRQALDFDPYSPEALIQFTLCLGWTLWADRRPPDQIIEMRSLAQRAILADPDDGRGYMLAGIAELWLRQSTAAKNLLCRAIELNPSLVQAHANLGSLHLLAGDPERALGPLNTAMRLSPNDIHMFYPLGEIAMAHLMCGRWSDALEYADLSLSCRRRYWYSYVVKINALARRGDLAAAHAVLGALGVAIPAFSDAYIEWLPFVDLGWVEYLCRGLTLARQFGHPPRRFGLAGLGSGLKAT